MVGLEKPAHFGFALACSIAEEIDEFAFIPNAQIDRFTFSNLEAFTVDLDFGDDFFPESG